MSHGVATEWGKDNSATYKSRLGLGLFALYTLVYFGFVLINSTYPKLLGAPVGGVNFAILYGFGLIVLALLMAFLYNALCTRTEARLNQKTREIAHWYEALQASGKLPVGWTKQDVLVFCDALIGLEAEVTFADGQNLNAIDAFQRLFAAGDQQS